MVRCEWYQIYPLVQMGTDNVIAHSSRKRLHLDFFYGQTSDYCIARKVSLLIKLH